jgi:PAS domain S-box-containing protein
MSFLADSVSPAGRGLLSRLRPPGIGLRTTAGAAALYAAPAFAQTDTSAAGFILFLLGMILGGVVAPLGYRLHRRRHGLASVERAHLRQLQDSAQRYRAIIDYFPEAVCVVDPQGQYLERNATAQQLTGMGTDDVKGRSFLDLVVQEDRPQALAAVMQAKQGTPATTQFRVYTADQRVLHADLTAVPIVVDDQVTAIFGVTRNVTDRVEAERRLKVSEAKFRALFEQSRDGVLLHLGDGVNQPWQLIMANQAACKMLGRSEDELRRGGLELIASVDAADPAYQAGLAEAQQTGTYRAEHLCRRADGTTFMVEVTSSRVTTEAGDTYCSTVFRDISDRKRAERELRHSHENLRQMWKILQGAREQEQKRLARELHDDVGQLITALKLEIGQLKRRPVADQEFLDNKIADLEVLLDAVFDASRRLVVGLRPRALDDVGLAAACESLLQSFSQSTGIAHTFNCSHAEFTFEDALATSAFRIVQEALTNVARHARATQVAVELSLDEQRGAFIITIKDDGRGFDPSSLAERLSFGLLGMRERVHSHNGELSIDSAPGCGTQIAIELPVSPQQAGGVSQEQPVAH